MTVEVVPGLLTTVPGPTTYDVEHPSTNTVL